MIGYLTAVTEARCATLDILGAVSQEGGTLLLLGPHEPGFWEAFEHSPEALDRCDNPMDRWSTRVITALAKSWGGVALFPFGGPPHHRFMDFALHSGRAWQSPVGMLVHDTQGLMLSYRGAILLPWVLEVPVTSAQSPCLSCHKPCETACPVGALSKGHYDLAACHTYLDTGADCLNSGCAVRLACPVSQTYRRVPAQSAFHMRAFHP